jgi:hypothetical protein
MYAQCHHSLTNFRFNEGENMAMGEKWDANPEADFRRRLGKSPAELGTTAEDSTCPDIWELDNGDIAVIGTELTGDYAGRLPRDVILSPGERLVVIPRVTLVAAKPDIPDA